MTSLIIKILSWWIPKRRYSSWHCSVLELLVAALLFLFLPSITYPILYPYPDDVKKQNSDEQSESDIPQTESTQIVKPERPDNSHPVLRMIQTRNWAFIGLGVYMACILAPINEELLFRAGLQNCLQGALTLLFRKRKKMPVKTCRWLIAIISIILPALFFALIHYRSEELGNKSIESVIRSVANACVAWTLFAVICYSYIFFVRDMRLRDLFGTWREVFGLAFLGVKWIWIIVPSYVLSFLFLFIRLLTHTYFLPDPFCLIPLALVFGFLYYKTQSILPTIVLHILFNFTSICIILLPMLL